MPLSEEERKHFETNCLRDEALPISLFLHKIAQSGQINDKFYLRGDLDDTPLIVAAAARSMYAVELLIDQGADLNLSDVEAFTALHWACHERHMEMVRLLVKSGANVNVYDFNGNTPLLLAAEDGEIEMMELLIKNGANINHTLPHAESILAQLLEFNRLIGAEVLLKHGAIITPSVEKHILNIQNLDIRNHFLEFVEKIDRNVVTYREERWSSDI